MPALPRSDQKETVTLPPRQAFVMAETDVLVVGGGPAGIGAALGAAEAGAKVIIAERYGFFGGNATAALVMPFMSFHTRRPHSRRIGGGNLLPIDHGPGEPVVAGVVCRFLRRLADEKGAILPCHETGFTTPFDPELFKLIALDLLDEAGVQFLFHAFASDAIVRGDRIEGVVFETKSGPMVIRAGTIVDCTGDGDVAARAGAPFELGRNDGLVQPMTLMFRMAEFEREAFHEYTRNHPHQWNGVHGLWDLVRHATEAGHLELPREDMLFFATPNDREVSVNATRVTHSSPLLGIDVADLTYAEWESRRQMRQISAFLRRYVPGFEQAYLAQSGTQVGVREGRRIKGEYQLTAADVLGARKFRDVIARSAYPIDTHNPQGTGTILKHLPAGESYDIPYRSLLPQQVEGLLVAGRCISGSHEAHSSYRIMPISMAVGQAAGVAAAHSSLRHTTPRELSITALQMELLRQGADLGTELNGATSRPSVPAEPYITKNRITAGGK